VLEPGDLATQDLLGHEQPRRGAPEVKLLGHGDEVAQAAQLDGPRLTPAGCQTASKGCWTSTYATQTMTAWTEPPAFLSR
jgi:hypothetical protein